jgi:hypothetical protein
VKTCLGLTRQQVRQAVAELERRAALRCSGSSQLRGAGFVSVSRTETSPRRPAAIISGVTGRVHGFPFPTSLSQASRL